jgi:hypothetical protein
MIDTLKGAALIGTFIDVLTIFAMWVSLWENVWRVSVEPTRANVLQRRNESCAQSLALPSLIMDVVAVGGVSPDINPFEPGRLRTRWFPPLHTFNARIYL